MKPLVLRDVFRAKVRTYPKETRVKIGRALQQMETDFGHPHRHQGLGIRKLAGNFFEIRVGLDIRLVFHNGSKALSFVMAGNHDDVQTFLRSL